MQDEQIHISSEQNALIEEYKSHYNLLFLAYRMNWLECSAFILLWEKKQKQPWRNLRHKGKKIDSGNRGHLGSDRAISQRFALWSGLYRFETWWEIELVEELQKAGHTILMVGDGLNDSAALTLSDIGVVMNESADISKQMSDILLLDNRLDFFQELDWLSSSLQTLIKKNIQDTVVVIVVWLALACLIGSVLQTSLSYII